MHGNFALALWELKYAWCFYFHGFFWVLFVVAVNLIAVIMVWYVQNMDFLDVLYSLHGNLAR
jgi:hypothetical protein